jgi:hypothetical protein
MFISSRTYRGLKGAPKSNRNSWARTAGNNTCKTARSDLLIGLVRLDGLKPSSLRCSSFVTFYNNKIDNVRIDNRTAAAMV